MPKLAQLPSLQAVILPGQTPIHLETWRPRTGAVCQDLKENVIGRRLVTLPSPPKVLIVDQGASFGGSALVASVIANRMPPERYQVFLAAAIPPSFLRISPAAQPRVMHLAKPYSYVDQARTKGRWNPFPRPVRRLAGWTDLAVRLARNARYLNALYRQIRTRQIDIVHLNNGFENLEAHLAGWRAGCRIVVHAHGPCGSSRLTRRLARKARCCLAISRHVAHSFYAAGVPSDAVTVLSNPLTLSPVRLTEEERRRARVAHGIPADALVAGIVGRIVPWKGQLEFLRAFAIALDKVPGAVAAIIGEVTDDMEEFGRQLRREADRLGIAHRVVFTGFIADPREAYALVDVLVHSSIEAEPFGLVLTEAMALGLPVIAAPSGGPLEIVTDGKDGYLRDPRDPAAVGGSLAILLTDADHRQRIGAAARTTALGRYDPDTYVTRLANVYDTLLHTPLQATATREVRE